MYHHSVVLSTAITVLKIYILVHFCASVNRLAKRLPKFMALTAIEYKNGAVTDRNIFALTRDLCMKQTMKLFLDIRTIIYEVNNRLGLKRESPILPSTLLSTVFARAIPI